MEDRLLGGRVRLTQPAHGYRVAIDPVLLAAAVAPAPGQHVLDAGCGTAAAALCLAARAPAVTIEGVEINSELAGLALINVSANQATNRVSIVEGELAAFAAQNRSRFDQVMTNPPYHAAGTHSVSPRPTKAAAHGEGVLDLDGWIAAVTAALKPSGRLTLVHRADWLGDILAALDRRCGAALIFPLWPRAEQPAKRVIVTALKGRKTRPRLLPGLVLHTADGAYTPQVEAILRHGAGLDLFAAAD